MTQAPDWIGRLSRTGWRGRRQPLVARAWAVLGGISVRSKIMGMILGLTLLLGLGVTMQVRLNMRRTLGLELDLRGISITRDLAARSADPILIHDTYALYRLLQDTTANNQDVRYAFVLDAAGHVLVHSFGGVIDEGGGALSAGEGFPVGLIAANPVGPVQRQRHLIIDTNEGLVHDFAAPILGGRAGTARIGLSEARMLGTLNAVTGQMLLTTAVVAVVGIAAAAFLTWLLTRPILDLVAVTRAVARGDLSQKARPLAADEIGRLSEAFNQMVDDLAAAEAESQAYLTRLGQLLDKVIHAQEEERKRIARGLHDETSQALTSVMVGLKVLERAGSVAEMRRQAEDLGRTAGQALDDVRSLALELRPSLLDDLGLIPALERYAAEFGRKFHLVVDFHTVGCDGLRLLARVETALYRIVQEALANVARHAAAGTVSVLVERRAEKLVVIVEDDGRGFDAARLLGSGSIEEQLGLFGMRERASLAGGQLSIESRPGAGTTIFVEVPLDDLEVATIELDPTAVGG